MNYWDDEGLAQALFEESNDALFLFDPETEQILDANAAAQRLCGFSLRDLRDTRVDDLLRSVTSAEIERGVRATTRMRLGGSAGRARRASFPFVECGCVLRTFQEGVCVPVDVVVTRLSVQPRPLALLALQGAKGAKGANDPSQQPRGGQMWRLVTGVSDCLWSARLAGKGEGQFLLISPVIERISGRPASHFGKRMSRWCDLIHPEDRRLWFKANEQRRAGEATQDEYRLVWPDGSIHWVRDSARSFRANAGRVVRLYGIYTDITERKQAEATLRRKAAVLDGSDDAIIDQTLGGLIVDWNRGAERLYDYDKTEVCLQPVLRILSGDGAISYSEAVQQVRRGEPVEPFETAHVDKHGRRVVVSVRLSPIDGADGRLDGISLIARPVTRMVPQTPSEPDEACNGHDCNRVDRDAGQCSYTPAPS